MLVFAAIAPHGGDTIAEIADDPRVMEKTRTGLQELGRRFAAARPETVVVLNPHGLVMEGVITIGAAATAVGALGPSPLRQVAVAFDTDLQLVQDILEAAAAQKVPMTPVAQRDARGEARVPLDWGALVPLWFTAWPMRRRPQVVVLAPDRSLPRETLVRCGLAIAQAAQRSGKRVALIASCDQGHAHDAGGPYGYSPASAAHDREMCDVIAENRLPDLLDWPEEMLEEAKVDAYWQTIMLAGALGLTPMHGELLSYEAPTYFGMAVASYLPNAAM